ncbi:MAG TPA: class I SAM-dependent methyltransferase [Solirubrobacterales bacterium]|nr:class I SAM-dependent methyltransferase [Solirubrobacterales bacterium]
MQDERAFAPACRALRDGIIEHYRDRGEAIDDDSGLRTLDTNTTLVPQRGRLLIELLRGRGLDSVEGLEVADLGCGFGAIALYLASLGARVTGIDPNYERARVAGAVAADLGLAATFQRGWIEAAPLPDAAFDLVVLNNSFCYVTEPSDRREALGHAHRVSRPGAWLVMRNPSIGAPLDPFTGLPLVHQLPRQLADPALRLTVRGRTRSQVRLMTAGAARRELRRAGFSEARVERPRGERRPSRYQHLTARRPEALAATRSAA